MADLDARLWLLAAALIVDAIVGEPGFLWRRVPHPITAIGAGIAWLDERLNFDRSGLGTRTAAGVLAAVSILVAGLIAGGAIGAIISILPFSHILEILTVAIFLAGRGLYDHVAAVAAGLRQSGVQGGRAAVRHIVGRDPESLDEAGVARAAIESLAENFSDGVIAPAFWYLVFGLPGLIAYKAINTGDSMIGHRTPRYADFGKATARADDLANWIPARLSGGLIVAAAWAGARNWRRAVAAMRRDAPHHRSVNAGWPEAAIAGALGLALAGPRHYEGVAVPDTVMNAGGRREAGASDIRAALSLTIAAAGIFVLGIIVIATVI